MIKGLYSIRDELVAYGPPIALPGDEVAIREFRRLCLSPQLNEVNQNKNDVVLFRVGSFDDQSGEITQICHVQLLRASEVEKDDVSNPES